MKTYKRKNKRGGLFGFTRTSKYKNVKLSNEELQKKITEKDAIIAEKDQEISELNKEIKQLDWDLKSSEQRYKSLRDSNPSQKSSPISSPKVSFDIQDIETTISKTESKPERSTQSKENNCIYGQCNVMGGKKGKTRRHKRKSKGKSKKH